MYTIVQEHHYNLSDSKLAYHMLDTLEDTADDPLIPQITSIQLQTK